MTSEKFLKRGRSQGHSRDPVNFSALNVNSSKMDKGMSFKFYACSRPGQSVSYHGNRVGLM